MNQWRNRMRILASVFISTLFILVVSCEEKESGFEGEYYTLALLNGAYYNFSGTVNSDLTSNCGEATQETTTTTTQSTTSATTPTTTNRYKITLYYNFDIGEATFNYPLGKAYLYTKFVYDTYERKFSLTPTTTTTSTCATLDYIKCNGTTGVNPQCVTVDKVTCGGENAFSFVSVNQTNDGTGNPYPGSETFAPTITYQAQSGTIDYSGGFSLDTNSAYVTLADLDFNMVSQDGTVFKGNVYCQDYN